MPHDTAGRSAILRFGVFDVDLRSGELRKAGLRVPLQEQPFRILARLLDTPGELVTRDELRQLLWADDTFVDFEHGLNVAIKRLRDALGDAPDGPRFIETLPRRGYRFIAPVLATDGGSPAAPAYSSTRRRVAMWSSAAALAIAAGALAVVAGRHAASGAAIRPQKILIADFVNRTHDDVFDGTLRQALTVALEQSPSFVVVSRERVRDLLRQMTTPDAPVVAGVALEACQRAGAHASVNGTIAALGTRYVVSLDAVDCASRETIATDQAQAERREHVLDALGGAASRLRVRLGESAATRTRFDRPLREATTSSLEALQAFSVAEDTREAKGDLAGEPFYRRALERDPEFAMAHARLSGIYANTGRVDDMNEATRRAYAGRSRVTEREQLYIDLRYCAAGMSGKAPGCLLEVPELWKRTYPLDWAPRQTIAFWTERLGGDLDAALPDAIEAVRLNPDHFLTYDTLAATYQALNRFDEARRVVEAGLAHRLDAGLLHDSLFELAFAQGDRATMAAQRAWFSGRPEEQLFRFDDLKAAMSEGRLKDGRELRGAGAPNASGPLALAVLNAQAGATMDLAAVGAADRTPLQAGHGLEWQGPITAAILSGQLSKAEAWLRECRCDAGLFAEPARILLAIARGHREAIAQLSPPAPRQLVLRFGYAPVYLRGLAYLHAGDGAHAAAEFQRIIDHRGVDPTSVFYPLAYVQQARSYARAGDTAKARAAYERFFDLWKHADPDVPILVDAKREYARLMVRSAGL